MAKVQHGYWFYLTVDNLELRARYYDKGFNYSTLEIWKEYTYTGRKYLIFGPKVEKKGWKNIVCDSRDEFFNSTPVINRSGWYDAMKTRKIITEIVRKISDGHTERI